MIAQLRGGHCVAVFSLGHIGDYMIQNPVVDVDTLEKNLDNLSNTVGEFPSKYYLNTITTLSISPDQEETYFDQTIPYPSLIDFSVQRNNGTWTHNILPLWANGTYYGKLASFPNNNTQDAYYATIIYTYNSARIDSGWLCGRGGDSNNHVNDITQVNVRVLYQGETT